MNGIARFPRSQSPDKVFALIIGIDEYRSIRRLHGCVNDANMFKNFLLDSPANNGLGVPLSNIKFLINEAATRDRIISTFQSHFLHNKAIPDGGEAAIIFYFAGHGSRVKAPGNRLPADGKVETICPYDERCGKGSKYVHSIPDYVLAWLLSELGQKKGRNITVICDSCHSGGMGRDDIDDDVRTPPTSSKDIPPQLDSHLWKGKNDVLSYRLWSQTTKNHVLLAACAQDETARETVYDGQVVRGRFTKELVNRLRALPLRTTTYVNLIRGLAEQWENQHPQCVGTNQDRLVFSTQFPDTMQHAFLIARVDDAPNDSVAHQSCLKFSVAIGSVGGVARNTRFHIYTENHAFLCTLVADSVDIHQTLVMSNKELPNGAYAVVANWRARILRVHPHTDFLHTAALFPTALPNFGGRRFVRSDDTPHLVLYRGNDTDEVIVEHWLERGIPEPHKFPVRLYQNIERLSNIIDGIAHFHYFLELVNECQDKGARFSGVALEMHRLKGQFPQRKPDLGFGKAEPGNLVDKFEVQARFDRGAIYGLTIRNNSCEDLFPYLFMFDADDYSIDCWYAPPNVHVGGPLHKQGGTVTLGMGGEPAFKLDIPAGQSRSSGFLKLFVSTTALDLCWIEQESLLTSGDGRCKMSRETIKAKIKWDTICVAIRMSL